MNQAPGVVGVAGVALLAADPLEAHEGDALDVTRSPAHDRIAAAGAAGALRAWSDTAGGAERAGGGAR